MGNEALSAETTPLDVDYRAVQQSPEFQTLRRTHRNFVFPVLGACLAWYFAYVLLATYAHDFMSTPGDHVVRALREPAARPARHGDPR